jgi:cyclohexanecarboxyl-CoA dehydrogenase
VALDFSFSPEHEAWREQLREFAAREIRPRSREWDESGELPRDVIRSMGQAGIFGVIGPKALGGQERDYVSLGIAIEELAAADISCAIVAWLQATISRFLPGWGDETVRAVHRGDAIVALATSEEGAGSDVSAMTTRAVADGDHYVINGTKIHVSLVPGADVLAVSAKVDQAGGEPRIAMLRVPSDAPGVSTEVMEQMGARAHRLGVINLKDVRVPIGSSLGAASEGKAVMYARYNVSRCLSPLAALGAAAAVVRETMQFACRKVVFGKPIAANQSISFPLVEHKTRIEAARLLAYRALWMNDVGKNASRDAAMAKWFGITTGVQAISECLQMYGANGYLREWSVEQRLRDVTALLFTGGTINIMKLILVRELLGSEFAGLRS